MSAVAQLAHHQGYQVSGCDLQESTPYIQKVKKMGIKTYVGHNPEHLKNIDLLAVSPAAFFQKDIHPELKLAQKQKKAITWQRFLGQYLHKDKTILCIAGTHGKSTTTAMVSLLFEQAKLDPSVMIGATIPQWGNNCRFGNSKIFITESDEFYDNFLNYKPDVIILNNIEMDHPDYFKSKKQLFNSFRKHLLSLKGKKILIVNQDDPGNQKLLSLLPNSFFKKHKIIGYTLSQKPLLKTQTSYSANITSQTSTNTTFSLKINNKDHTFTLKTPGIYNVSNALGVIILGLKFNIPITTISSSLKKFAGIGRRMELLSSSMDIPIYDDYAHHPTAIKVTLSGLKQKYPNKKIFAIIEPHSFSRTKKLLTKYKNAFSSADQVIIAPIFPARDTHNYGVNESHIISVSQHKKIKTLPNFESIVKYVTKHLSPDLVIIVMGAGNSYKLSRLLQEKIRQYENSKKHFTQE